MLHFSLSLMNRLEKNEKKIYYFHFFVFGLVALEGSTFTRIFIFTTAGVKCCEAAVKSRPDFISVLLYFFWSFGINDSNTFSIAQAGARGVRDVAIFIISHEQTQENRVCNFHFFVLVWLLSRDRHLPDFLTVLRVITARENRAKKSSQQYQLIYYLVVFCG